MDLLNATVAIVSAVLGGLVGGLWTWLSNREQTTLNNRLLTKQMEQIQNSWEQDRLKLNKNNETLNRQLDQSKKQYIELTTQVDELKKIQGKYLQVRSRLEKSYEVQAHRQPVLLVGPRMVGKTSLLAQWHVPWDHSTLDRTQTSRICDVPVFSFIEPEKGQHFADPDILVTIETQLLLRVHDFPGEVDYQKAIREAVVSEMQILRSKSRKNLGLVLVCMFNAEEAETGISRATREYYNGELFRELRSLVTFREVELERLIFVFNKYDRLRQRYKERVDDRKLLELCIDKFDYVFDSMRSYCNPDKVCEIFTILDRDNLNFNNQGATIVKGEAARGIVHAFAKDNARAQPIIEQKATNILRSKFI